MTAVRTEWGDSRIDELALRVQTLERHVEHLATDPLREAEAFRRSLHIGLLAAVASGAVGTVGAFIVGVLR